MKKLLYILALLLPAIVSAQTTNDKVTLSAAHLQPGGNDVDVIVSLDGSEHLYTAFQMDITLPEGIELTYDEDNELNVWIEPTFGLYTFKKGQCSHTIEATYNEVGDNVIRISCISLANTLFTATKGELFVMTLKATADANIGNAPLEISNCKFITYDKDATPTTVGYQIKQTELNGVTVNAFLNIDPAIQWSTLILPYSASLPAGLEAYTCNSKDDTNLLLTPAKAITGYTPYILHAQNGFNGVLPYTADAARPSTDIVTVGYLSGAVTPQTIYNAYVLQNGFEGVKFYNCNGAAFHIPAGKCWVTLSGEAAKVALGMVIDDPSGINTIMTDNHASDIIYNLNGQRVSTMTSGTTYIINGKKIKCQ